MQTGRIGSRAVRKELIAPLQTRFDALCADYRIRLETLLLIQAHYKILSLIEELDTKMERWRTGDSLLLFTHWLDEYNVTFC